MTSGSDRALYSTPETLYSGLYAMDGDGTYLNQHSWTKKTGRYPAIPTVWQLTDDLAQSFRTTVKKSEYASRWPGPRPSRPNSTRCSRRKPRATSMQAAWRTPG